MYNHTCVCALSRYTDRRSNVHHMLGAASGNRHHANAHHSATSVEGTSGKPGSGQPADAIGTSAIATDSSTETPGTHSAGNILGSIRSVFIANKIQ